MKKFHAFYITAVGHEPQYMVLDKVDEVLALVKKANDPDYSNIRNLRVIWGQLLEFEPATVVETYRIKRPFDE